MTQTNPTKKEAHIKTLSFGIANEKNKKATKSTGCGECQASCQSACKTSCTVANQKCENTQK
ncbi:MAG: six-cysteine ranthipeptide SCIFF [Oscillospiraceae bacterium]|nr:six-cysteine ranthipeptide SCIFF [Oscillospiraceae bacterium]MCL2160089.1 six-cysteine ranthipeptide SCIFF [Oscillospiraceae bacterium]